MAPSVNDALLVSTAKDMDERTNGLAQRTTVQVRHYLLPWKMDVVLS